MVERALSRQKRRELRHLLNRIDGCDASPEEKHRLRDVWMNVRDDIIDLENREQ